MTGQKKPSFQRCGIFLISGDIRDIIKHNEINNKIFIRAYFCSYTMEKISI